MYYKATILFTLIAAIVTSCSTTSSRPGILPEPYTYNVLKKADDSLVKYVQLFCREKQYDSVFILGRQWAAEGVNNSDPGWVMRVARMVYDSLEPAPGLRKDYALFIFNYRPVIEKDSAALKQLYGLFTYKYCYDFFNRDFDPGYIEIAEYFISLPKRFSFLNSAYAAGFIQSLGITYHTAGDLEKARYYGGILYTMDRADTNQYYLPASAVNLGAALIENRQYDSTLRIATHALRKRNISPYEASGLYVIMADAFLQLDSISKTRAAIAKAAALVPLINDADSAAKKMREVAAVQAATDYRTADYRESIGHCRQALAAGVVENGTYRNRVTGKTLLQMGASWAKLGNTDSAAWCYHQALYTVAQTDSLLIEKLPAEQDVYAENTLMDALDSLAGLWDRQYAAAHEPRYPELALQARKLAFIAERKLLEAFSYDESMKNQLLAGKARSEKALRNCYVLWQATGKPAWVQQALLVNENSKAIALLHSIKRNNVISGLGATDSAITALEQCRYQAIQLEGTLNRTQDAQVRKHIAGMLDSLNSAFIAQERTVNSQYPALKRSGIDTSYLSFNNVRKILPAGGCLLQYFAADSGAYVLWMDKENRCGLAYVPPAALQVTGRYVAACRHPPLLTGIDTTAFFNLADSCTKMVIPPAVQQAIGKGNCKNLVVIPDGIFSFLPFDALTTGLREYLVNQCVVYTGYSLGTLLLNKSNTPEKDAITVFTPFSSRSLQGQPRLMFTRNEAAAVKQVKEHCVLFDDTAATLNQFRTMLEQNGTLHIATHATGDTPRIYFSDSVLYMAELYASHTNAGLVVLSDCETGTGAIDRNEGPLSLARGFYYAGARNVIYSLWGIDDAATASIFSVFYTYYHTGNGAAALQRAKQAYLLENGQLALPYYWAGLVHTGLDVLPADKYWWGWPYIITGLAAGLLLFAYTRRRKRLYR